MATPEGAITAPDVSTQPASSASTATDSSSVPQGTSTSLAPTAPAESAGGVTTDVQGTSEPDVLADVPSIDELNQQADQGVKYAKALANLRGALEPLKTQHAELTQKYEPYQSYLERFEQPEQLAEVLDLRDGLIGWTTDPSGQPVPSTERGAQVLHERFTEHANDLVGQLVEMPVFDSVTGRQMSRWEVMLHGAAEDPTERAKVAQIFGLVEPSAVAPQWQPSEDELAVVRPELQDVYRKLPYEEREELRLASPDFINRTLEREKLTQELAAQAEQSQQRQLAEQQQRETYINQQAIQAGNEYLGNQLNQALSTFHESVVQQCNFIKPLDPSNLPQGITPEQAQTINSQVAASNKAEAAQITGLIVSLFNPQTKAYVLPLLKEIGAVDDKMLNQLDSAASTFGNNARNYGNRTFRDQLNANGNYQPDASVTQMNNEAQRALKTMIGYANQIRGKLMEQRSKFFELTAQQHNSTLNGAAQVRPPLNGTGYNPTTAPPTALPTGKMTRDEINRLYG